MCLGTFWWRQYFCKTSVHPLDRFFLLPRPHFLQILWFFQSLTTLVLSSVWQLTFLEPRWVSELVCKFFLSEIKHFRQFRNFHFASGILEIFVFLEKCNTWPSKLGAWAIRGYAMTSERHVLHFQVGPDLWGPREAWRRRKDEWRRCTFESE